jgi:hypothetical protein
MIERPCILAGIPGSEPALAGTIRVEISGVGYTVPVPALDPDEFYYLSGDGGAFDLWKILEDALNDQLSGQSFAITHDNDGRGHINCDDEFRILGAHVDTTIDLTVFGLDNIANHPAVSGPQDYDIPRQHAFGFFPQDQPSEHPLDALPVVATGAVTVSGRSRVIKLSRSQGRHNAFGWTALDGALVRTELADADHALSVFELTWGASSSAGYPLRFYVDTTDRATFKTYRVRPEGLQDFPWSEAEETAVFWDLRFPVIRTDD